MGVIGSLAISTKRAMLAHVTGLSLMAYAKGSLLYAASDKLVAVILDFYIFTASYQIIL